MVTEEQQKSFDKSHEAAMKRFHKVKGESESGHVMFQFVKNKIEELPAERIEKIYEIAKRVKVERAEEFLKDDETIIFAFYQEAEDFEHITNGYKYQ